MNYTFGHFSSYKVSSSNDFAFSNYLITLLIYSLCRIKIQYFALQYLSLLLIRCNSLDFLHFKVTVVHLIFVYLLHTSVHALLVASSLEAAPARGVGTFEMVLGTPRPPSTNLFFLSVLLFPDTPNPLR